MNAEQFKKWHDSLPEVEPTEEEREAIRQASFAIIIPLMN